MNNNQDSKGITSRKPYWYPKITDADWIKRIRLDYPEDTIDLNDEAVRGRYANGAKYATTWDHTGDAYDDYEGLADEFLKIEASNAKLGNELVKVKEENEQLRKELKSVPDLVGNIKPTKCNHSNYWITNYGNCMACDLSSTRKALEECVDPLIEAIDFISEIDDDGHFHERLNKALASAKAILSSHEAGEGKGEV